MEQAASDPILLMLFLLAIPVCVCYICKRLAQRPSEPGSKKLHWYKGGLPIIGPAIVFHKAPEELLLKARRQLGDVFGLDLVAKRFVFVTGPDAHRWFFNADDGTDACELGFEKAVESLTSHIFGRGMYSTPGWTERSRKLIVTGMGTAQRLTYYTGNIQDEVNRSLADWARKGTVDLFRECSRLAIAIMTRCLMGDDVIERFPELGNLYHEFERLGARPEVAQFSWFPSGAARRFRKVRRRLYDILEAVVRERYDRPDEHRARQDYLQYVINDSPGFPQILSLHLLALLFAGHINTAATMAWNIAHIASDEALKGAVCSEVRSESDPLKKGASTTGVTSATGASRSDLSVLDKCMRETNRMYGILLLVREVLRPTSFGGVNFPKGTMIAFSPFTVHRDESVYKEASRFNPERFSKPAFEELNAKRQYIPFGAGRHACQGQRLVTLVLRIAWSALFKDYEISIGDKQLPQPEYFGALGTPLPKFPVTMHILSST